MKLPTNEDLDKYLELLDTQEKALAASLEAVRAQRKMVELQKITANTVQTFFDPFGLLKK